jgi:hypothetical protein
VEAHRAVRRRGSHISLTIDSQMAVRLSPLRAGLPACRPLPPGSGNINFRSRMIKPVHKLSVELTVGLTLVQCQNFSHKGEGATFQEGKTRQFEYRLMCQPFKAFFTDGPIVLRIEEYILKYFKCYHWYLLYFFFS